MKMMHDGRRGGFALALTLVFMLVLTAGVLAAMNKVSSEYRVLDDTDAGVQAYLRAEAGLDAGLQEWAGGDSPPADREELELELENGDSAIITAYELRPENNGTPALYAIQSRGINKQSTREGSPDATRSVAQLAIWRTGDLDLDGGWVGLTGLVKNGNSGKISGADGCEEADSIAGAAVPEDPGYNQNGGDPENVLEGDPPVDSMAPTPQDAAEMVDIDWEGIVNGETLTPDYVIGNNDPIPNIGPEEWPIIYVDNPGQTYKLNDNGRGTLIVRGDMEANGQDLWDGIVMIGGKATLSGKSTISGGMISGLNLKLGESGEASEVIEPDESEVGNGNITVQYDSCNVDEAMKRFSGFQIFENTWTDRWTMN